MSEFSAENLVDDVAVVRQQDEAGRILVQPPDRKNPLRMADLRNDIARDMRFARGRDADRLMILDIESRFAPWDDTALAGDDIIGRDLITQSSHSTVDRDDT